MQLVKVALAEGQVTILDSGLSAGQNVVVDGADRLRPGQTVTASGARQKGGQAAQGAASGSGLAGGGKGNGQQNKKEQQ
jgi:multidrug efflux system membrane fusion protein